MVSAVPRSLREITDWTLYSMWFQQDGASVQTTNKVWKYLKWSVQSEKDEGDHTTNRVWKTWMVSSVPDWSLYSIWFQQEGDSVHTTNTDWCLYSMWCGSNKMVLQFTQLIWYGSTWMVSSVSRRLKEFTEWFLYSMWFSKMLLQFTQITGYGSTLMVSSVPRR